ncbi:MAG: molybdopterin-binding protein [Bacteroidetes bacterium]|nr:molybdopterin-binding protein [Bacteroidota bacterium]
MEQLKVVSVNISEKKGTVKTPADGIILTHQGVEGDAHSGPWNRQLSLLGIDSIRKFEQKAGRNIRPGEFAENITLESLDYLKVHPLDRLTCGEVKIEITQIGKDCHGTSCSIFREVGDCVMPKEGIFARVLHPGIIRGGDIMEFHPRMYRAFVVTLSDRASSGEYEDRSGARLQEILREFFKEMGLKLFIHYTLIPDDRHKLEDLVHQAKDELVDFVFTTGGTGIGPRDFTVDIIKPMLDKEIPGIMEMIRMKYGALKTQALISRSVAGVMGKTLVFTLPGSVKAVNEYMEEIRKSLLHLVFMMHGLEIH